MEDIFVYLVDMPPKVKEAVIPCLGGYTIYIDRNLCEEARYAAFVHAVRHISGRDFEKDDVQQIEWTVHDLPGIR